MGIPYWQALLNTSDWGMANMQWNLGWEKMAFYDNLSAAQINASGAYDWILDPRIALQQVSQSQSVWSSNSNGVNMPAWQNIGNSNWNTNFMSSPWPSMGWQPTNTGGSGTSSKTETSDQKDMKKVKAVFDSIKNIVKKNEKFINPDLLVEFEEAAKDYKEETDEEGNTKRVKKTDEEKLADMKAAMKKFGAKRLRIALFEGEYATKLKNTGFDFKNSDSTLKKNVDSDIDSELSKLYTDLSSGKFAEFGTAHGGLNGMGKDNILEYISKWNEIHKGDKERSILKLVADKLPSKNSAYPPIIAKYTQTLIEKASDYDSYANVKSKITALESAQAALNTTFSDENATLDSKKAKVRDVAEKFEALYAQVRMQEAAELSKEIKDKYADILNDIIPGTIPDNIVVGETKLDLQSENIAAPSAETIQEQNYDDGADNSNSGNVNGLTWSQELTGASKAKVEKLIENGALESTDSTDPVVYYNKDYNHFYTIKNGTLYYLKDAKEVTRNGYVRLANGKEVPVKNAIGGKANLDALILKSERQQNTAKAVSKQSDGAYSLGYQVADDLISGTNADELKRVKEALAVINKNNVKEFLQGYYKNSSWGNGLFLQLGTEDSRLKNKEVVPIMKAIIDAIPADKKDSDDARELKRIYYQYARLNGESAFELPEGSGKWGWNRIWGIDDLDQFDDAVERIFGLN